MVGGDVRMRRVDIGMLFEKTTEGARAACYPERADRAGTRGTFRIRSRCRDGGSASAGTFGDEPEHTGKAPSCATIASRACRGREARGTNHCA